MIGSVFHTGRRFFLLLKSWNTVRHVVCELQCKTDCKTQITDWLLISQVTSNGD
jgi:hypothetical protein